MKRMMTLAAAMLAAAILAGCDSVNMESCRAMCVPHPVKQFTNDRTKTECLCALDRLPAEKP